MAANLMTRSASSPALYAMSCSPEPPVSLLSPPPLGFPQKTSFPTGFWGAIALSPRVQSSGSLSQVLNCDASPRNLSARASGGQTPMSSPFPDKRQQGTNNSALNRIHSSDDVWQLNRSQNLDRSSSGADLYAAPKDFALESMSPEGKAKEVVSDLPLLPLSMIGSSVKQFMSSAHGLVPNTLSALDSVLPRQSLPKQASCRCEAIAEEEHLVQGVPARSEPLEQSPADGDLQDVSELWELTDELTVEPAIARTQSAQPDLSHLDAAEECPSRSEPSPTSLRGHPEVTEDYYSRALADDPENALILRNYARFLIQTRGDFVAAEKFLERAIICCPSDADVLVQYAKLLWEFRRDADRAMMYYERAVQAAPEDCYVLAAYASFLWSVDSSSTSKQSPQEPMSSSEVLAPSPA